MERWLIFLHAPNPREYRLAIRILKKLQERLTDDCEVVVILFGMTIFHPCYLLSLTCDGINKLKELPNSNGIDSVVPNCERFIETLKSLRKTFQAVCIYSHGASWALGPFKKWKRPFLPIVDAVRIFIRPFPIKLVVFDSCYQGGMSCLYELPSYTQVVIAAPAFHPFTSILETKKFSQINPKVFKSREHILTFAHDMTCEWHTLTKVSWKCLMVFDMQYMNQLAHLVGRYFDHLIFDKTSQIDHKDSNLHDLYTAARSIPAIQGAIQRLTHKTCQTCRQHITKRVHGPSMEKRLPIKWRSAFKRTRWYRDIAKGHSRFSERLHDIGMVNQQ